MYAIIESCGKQYKVAEGDVVFFEKLDTEEGKKVTFDKVILVSEEGKVQDPLGGRGGYRGLIQADCLEAAAGAGTAQSVPGPAVLFCWVRGSRGFRSGSRPANWEAVPPAPCRWPGSLSKESCFSEANPTMKTEGPGSGGGDSTAIGPEQTLGKRVKQVVA